MDRATSEMQTSTFLSGGVADYNATVNGLDELSGVLISAEAMMTSTNRVDAHEAELVGARR